VAILVNIKTKKQEKAVKDFLNELDIEFQTLAGEDAVPYKTTPEKSLTPKEKKILSNLDQSVAFVKKYEQGKTKAKSLKQLLNEL